MKKAISILFLLILVSLCYGQEYKTYLDKVNEYFVKFDGGYYGHLEIKEGILFNYFKSGDYSKANIFKLSPAIEEEVNRKVVMNCTDSTACVFSTYTNSYHDKMQFSTSTDFNTHELIDLFNKLITSYTGQPEYKQYENNSAGKSDEPEVNERSRMADERIQGK
jgi:hypothetical protein